MEGEDSPGIQVQTTESEPTMIEKPDHNYALYQFHKTPINHNITNGISNDSLDMADDDIEEKESVNFSLTILSTDLMASEEMELRTHLRRKLVKGMVTESSICSVGLQANDEDTLVQPNSHGCYYRLCVDKDDEEQGKGFIICFLTKQERGLDLFHTELDKYSQEIESKMDGNFTSLQTSVNSSLESWYNEIILYTTRSISQLKDDVKYVIYAALMDKNVEIVNSTKRTELDIQRFVTACSLKEMLTSDQDENLVLVQANKESASLIIDFGKDPPSLSDSKTTLFCIEWAETLHQALTSNPFCHRQIIESYKLKIIQDMNHLRRLLKHSETDHYALFKTYAFLKSSGNVPVMLYQAQCQSQTPLTSEVLKVLDEYIASVDKSSKSA